MEQNVKTGKITNSMQKYTFEEITHKQACKIGLHLSQETRIPKATRKCKIQVKFSENTGTTRGQNAQKDMNTISLTTKSEFYTQIGPAAYNCWRGRCLPTIMALKTAVFVHL